MIYDEGEVLALNSDVVITIIAAVLGIASALSSLIIIDLTGKRTKMKSEKLLSGILRQNIRSIKKRLPMDMRIDDNFSIAKLQKFDSTVEELIQNHHEQAIFQSKVQFWFSLGAAVVGFVFIIVMISTTTNSKWYEYLLKILPGAIIETVSILFFSQSKETREQASDFLNRLREDRQFEKGTALAAIISDEKLKDCVTAKIAMHLCGIESADDNSEKTNNTLASK